MSDPAPTDPTTQTGFTACLEELRARATLIVAARPANKAALFDALAGAGITAVRVAFDGSCDEGQIEAIAARAGETPVELPPDLVPIREPRRDGTGLEIRPCPIGEAIEILAYDLLEASHGGWENDDGAFGTFTFDVAARVIRLEHSQRYTEVATSEHVF